MFPKIKAAGLTACAVLLGSAVVVGQAPKTQQPPNAERASSVDTEKGAAQGCAGCELPITLRQSVVAGKTAVGAKVDGQLLMATMMKGEVIPRRALISGEVIESVAKSGNSSSRLAIRMDSAQWKNGGVKFKGYLTGWYYPLERMALSNLSNGPPGDPRNWGGVDYTDPPNAAMAQQNSSPHPENVVNASIPASIISGERVPMKNLETMRGADGSIVLVSARSSINLNKVTVFVLAVNEVLPGK